MKYFLVYNDNTHNKYLDKLLESVSKYGKDFSIIKYDKKEIDKDFVKNNKKILDCKRGGGYWLWKAYIIYEQLKKINEGDIVFYLDSKYYFVEDFTDLYSKYMEENDILVWKNKPNEGCYYMKNYCKMDVIKKYNMYNDVFNKNLEDCWAGAIVIKKTDNSLNIIKEWLDKCCVYDNITDSPSREKNNDLFKEHRHDQSLLSITLHKNNIPLHFFEKKYLENVRKSWYNKN